MLHDTIMSLVVVVVIIGLAVVWKLTIPGDHTSVESGWLGKLYDEPADPGTISFVPRPDWYFYFLFYLLRIFKWPESVILGTIGVPTICVLLLIAMPFIDVRAERRPLHRPVAMVAAVLVILSMGILTWKGATAKESLGSEVVALVPEWAKEQGFEGNKPAIAGATLFAESGCLNCHTYLGAGNREPRRARPLGDRRDRSGRRVLRPLRGRSVAVRQQRDVEVRQAGGRRVHGSAAAAGRRVPERLQGRRVVAGRAAARVGFATMRVFLGITGASGALYAQTARRGPGRWRLRGRALRLRRRDRGARDRALR